MIPFTKLVSRLHGLSVKTFAVAFLAVMPIGNLLQAQPLTSNELESLRGGANRALFIDAPLPPLAAHTYSKLPVNANVRIEHVTFATQYELRVPAIVYIPTHHHGKVPGIVVVCGHGGDKSSWYAVYTGLLYATAGSVVVTYDPAGEFERSVTRGSETNEHDKLIPGLTHTERVGGLMIEDAQQAIRYTASRPEVDASRIAVLGYSMGSFHAILASALSGPRLPAIRALVLSGGGNLDGADQYWDSNPKPNCQSGPYKALDFFPGGGDARGPILYALRARSGPTLALNGTEDSLITKFNELEPFFVDLRNRIAAVTGSRANLPETIWYEHVGHRPSFMTRAAALWLNQQLHFPNWTDAQINAFPTVRAVDWVGQTGVRISRGYQIEQKEGGILALDLHLPGLTREQLTAVPTDEWQKDPTHYTLPGWIPHALAAESTASSSVQSKHP
jgi:dienelactone hydrolase